MPSTQIPTSNEYAIPRPHPPGTIVVDPGAKFLYLVMEGGDAMRYGIGVGREGFGWAARRTSDARPSGRHGRHPRR